jgi:hypothetical protein
VRVSWSWRPVSSTRTFSRRLVALALRLHAARRLAERKCREKTYHADVVGRGIAGSDYDAS